MANVQSGSVNNPAFSPGPGSLAGLLPLAPIALGLLAGESGYESVKRELRAWSKKDPIDALVALVVGGGVAFYVVERDTNPGCKSPWDGILYMATALSVGYDNVFPTSAAGHALATFAQSFGPALAAASLDPPAAEQAAAAEANTVGNDDVLQRLDRIIQLLESRA